MKRIALAVLAVSLWAPLAQAQTYAIDPAHSSVTFTIRHLVGRVAGRFDKFDGTFSYDAAKPKEWVANATIQTASVNTGIEKRDNHLRTPDFFDAAKYPTMTFKSTGVTDVKATRPNCTGSSPCTASPSR